MARPAVVPTAPNAVVGVLLRLNQLACAAVRPTLNLSCERVLRARAAGDSAEISDSLEELAANTLLELERSRADERRALAAAA
jgi:4-aminobutyrate aminotransferase-like enzyme